MQNHQKSSNMAILKCALIAFFCLGFTHASRNAPSSSKLEKSPESEYIPPRNLEEAKGFNDKKVDPSSGVGVGVGVGYGFSSSFGTGIGIGSGSGTKVGSGSGSGVGYGSGSGSRSVGGGSGSGYGYGSGGGGSGTGYGSGFGSGSGSGSGSGYGYGSGSNSGYGPGSGNGGGTGIGIGVGQGGGNNGYSGWGCPGCDPPFQGPPCLPSPNNPNCGINGLLPPPPPPLPCVPGIVPGAGYVPGNPVLPVYVIPTGSAVHEDHPPNTEDGLTRGQAHKKPNNETPDPSAERKRLSGPQVQF